MKIGYVIWSLGLGGAEQVVIRLAKAMRTRGHDGVVVTLNEPGLFAKPLKELGVAVISVNKCGPFDITVINRMAKVFREHSLDLVHTHLWGANLWGRLAAFRAGIPVVITEHNVDTWKRWFHFLIDRWLMPKTSAFVAVSHEVRQFYEANDTAAGLWQVVHNGVETAPLPLRRRPEVFQALGFGSQDRVVGLVGRLVAAKAPHIFLEAIEKASQELPTLKALIVGDGPLRAEAESHARRLGIAERVIFAGLRQDVPALLAGMDVLAFSSEREGLSMAMLEAMAAGVPVVATRVGGTPELIESGVTGVLVYPNQPEELAEALVHLLQQPERAAGIARAARQMVESRFSLTAMAQAHESIYRRAVIQAFVQPAVHPRTVCYVIDHLGMGGAQRQLVELVKRLPRPDWRPIVIALSDAKQLLQPELVAAGITVHLIPQKGKADFRCLRRLKRLLRLYHPVIVHTALFAADTYGRLAAHQAGVPHIVAAMRNTIEDIPGHYRLVNRWLTRWTDAVTINAKAEAEGYTRQGGIPAHKLRTIHNGIAPLASKGPANGYYRQQWQMPAEAKIICMVARMSEQKDHRTFLEAMRQTIRQVPLAYAVLVGDGVKRAAVESWVQELGLEGRVLILGERRDARQLMEQVDLCVLATHYEGCSNAIMEAMVAGKPVVATRVGGNPELVVEGVTGLLVSPRDPEALSQSMVKLLQDELLRIRMGQQGRNRMEEQFSMEAMVRQTESLYRELLHVG